MNAIFGIGAGAGLASALLFAVITTGNPLAILLYFVAPLPVILAAMGWRHRAGLIAAVCGAVFVALLFSVKTGAAYALSVALPAWWFAYLTLLARDENGAVEWYPIGRLLMWMALLSAALTTAVSISIGRGDYESFVRAFEQILDVLRRLGTEVDSLPGEGAQSNADMARLMAAIAPPVSAAVGVASSALLVWIAARVTRASGRLPRPWPYLPAAATLPNVALLVFGAACVLGVALHGFAGLGARSLAASLLMAYCLQGLAVIHVLTVGLAGRVGVLSGVYFALVMIPGWPALIYALLGVADALLGLRAKRLAKNPPPPPAPPASI